MTLHPEGKAGVNIEKSTYQTVREGILAVLREHPAGVTLQELPTLIKPHLENGDFPARASVTWYCVTVKLDLEARGEIERIPKVTPQRLRLTS